MKPLGKALDEFRMEIAGQKDDRQEGIDTLVQSGQNDDAAIEKAKAFVGDVFLAYLQRTEKAHGRESYEDFVRAYAEALAPQIREWRNGQEEGAANGQELKAAIGAAKLETAQELLTSFTVIMQRAQAEEP